MKNQAYRMAMLYDFYGDLLTPRQKEFYDLYYNDDLSLAEIAENYDITRQGVRDIIVRAEKRHRGKNRPDPALPPDTGHHCRAPQPVQSASSPESGQIYGPGAG